MTFRPFVLWSFVAACLVFVAAVLTLDYLLESTFLVQATSRSVDIVHLIRGLVLVLGIIFWAHLFLIGEKRRTEREFKKLSRAIQFTGSSVIMTDRQGKIEYVNPKFTEMTGYEPFEVLGANPRILQSGKTPPATYRTLWETIVAGKDWHGEFLNRRKDGTLIWQSASISPVSLDRGKITHFVGVFEDISVKKQMEQMKDELVSRVSHDLRTPLGIIRWSIEDLKDDLQGRINSEQAEVIDGIRKNCERLEKVVGEVLDLTRLEAGKGKIRRVAINVADFLRERVKDMGPWADRNGLSLEADLPGEIPTLFADPEMMFRLVNNLIDNALRFARSRIVLEAKVVEGGVRIGVIDDGPGVAVGDREKIFGKFEQVFRKGGVNHSKGAGLGLAISREIVEKHGGRIWVEETPGGGAGFFFVMPLRQEPGHRGSDAPQRDAFVGGGGYEGFEEESSRH